ncbi:hypothetical protein N8457_00090 [bacterium]|nr:hypothetical protein [bacterium]
MAPGAQVDLPMQELMQQTQAILLGETFVSPEGMPQITGEEPGKRVMPKLSAMVDPEGRPLSSEQQLTALAEERATQREAVEFGVSPEGEKVSRYESYGIESRQDYLDQYSYLGDNNFVADVQRTSADLGTILNEPRFDVNTTPESSERGIDVLSTLLQTPNKVETSNALTKAYFEVGLGAYEKKENDPALGDFIATPEEEAASMANILGTTNTGERKADDIKAGGIEADNLHTMLGNAMFTRLHMPQFNEANQLVQRSVQSNPTNNNLAGQLGAKALTEKGLLVKTQRRRFEDPENKLSESQNPIVDVYVVGREGSKLIMSAREMTAIESLSNIEGRSQTVPVGDDGGYIGGLASVRRFDINRFGSGNTPQKQRQFQALAGQVGKVVNSNNLYFIAALDSLVNTGSLSPELNKRANKILNTSIDDPKMTEQAKQAKANVRQKRINALTQNLSEGKVRYSPHFNDPSVNRIYDDTLDMNMQSNTVTRGSIQASNRGLVVPSKRDVPSGQSLVSEAEAAALIASLADSYNGEFSAKQKELSFLWTLTANLQPEAEIKTIERNLQELTIDRMKEFAEMGGFLKTILPQGSDPATVQAVVSQGLDLSGLEPSDIAMLEKIILRSGDGKGMGKKNWGFILQSLMDAHSYMTENSFQPRTLTEIDMNSAGRAFLASDLGGSMGESVLERVGVFYEGLSDPNNPKVIPFGSPREHFFDLAKTLLSQKIYSKPEQLSEVNNLKHIMDQLHKNDPDFVDDFAKKVLLTTDYGKPINSHGDAAADFLVDYPELNAVLAKLGDDPAAELAKIYADTLSESTAAFQRNAPKQMSMILAFLNRVPTPQGYFGETIPFGMTRLEASGASVSGLQPMVNVLDPTSRGKPKRFEEEGVTSKTAYVPDHMTSVINAVGPVMGQYRESILLAETILAVNGGRDIPDFFAPVFDNLILDSTSALKFHYAANNVALKKAFNYKMVEAFEADYNVQLQEALSNLPEKVVLTPGSPYSGIMAHLDDQVDFLERVDNDDPRLSANVKEGSGPRTRQFLDAAKERGYVPYKERGDKPLTLTKGQLTALISLYINHNNVTKNIEKWVDSIGRDRTRMKINEVAYPYFMT